jgi:hypothetical protein
MLSQQKDRCHIKNPKNLKNVKIKTCYYMLSQCQMQKNNKNLKKSNCILHICGKCHTGTLLQKKQELNSSETSCDN